MTILVSPSYYIQRKAFYGDGYNVKPLLFPWNTLKGTHIHPWHTNTHTYMHPQIHTLRWHVYTYILLNGFQSFQRLINSKLVPKAVENRWSSLTYFFNLQCMYIYIYIYIYTHTHTHTLQIIYIYIYIYTHTHTKYIHMTCTRTQRITSSASWWWWSNFGGRNAAVYMDQVCICTAILIIIEGSETAFNGF
jgi:hypothetical protein